jgi:hypothetical protein
MLITGVTQIVLEGGMKTWNANNLITFSNSFPFYNSFLEKTCEIMYCEY